MPRWVKVMLLAMGLCFLGVGVLVGVVGTRRAQAHVALLERLRPLSSVAFDDQRAGTPALVEGVISQRNPIVLRNVVAYIEEEMDVTTDSDGDRSERWRSTDRETPQLVLEADGPLRVGNENYAIERAHKIWYDDATLDFDDRPRDGTKRYYGLVAGRQVTAFGTVVEGTEGNAMEAQTIFGGTYPEYLTSEREATAFFPIFGGIFGAAGFLLCALAIVFIFRY
jgi:hypothetical protein